MMLKQITIFREETTKAIGDFHIGPLSRSNRNLEMLVSQKGGKPENPKKNLGARREPTTNSTHTWHWAEIEHRPHWWERESSHHCTIPASLPSFLQTSQLICLITLKSKDSPRKTYYSYTIFATLQDKFRLRKCSGTVFNEVTQYHCILLIKQPIGAAKPQTSLRLLIRRGRLLRCVIKAGKVFTTVVRLATLWSEFP